MEFSTIAVKPAVPAAPYLGGKRNLARRLCQIIDATPHIAYAEPFVGMGGVFLRRTRRPKCEVINDLNQDVATFFRILQRHYVAFMDMLRFQLTTRAGFERLMRTDPSTLTDLERAARFLYLQRTAFGGKVVGRNFGMVMDGPARFDITRLGPVLEELHERLAPVAIECLPYATFIAKYDRPRTLFYLDPPYWAARATMAPRRSSAPTSSGSPTSWPGSAGNSSCQSTTRPACARSSGGSRSTKWRPPTGSAASRAGPSGLAS